MNRSREQSVEQKQEYWSVPQLWPGETAVILGGGPSLTVEQVELARRKGFRRIAVNNAFLLDPEADVLCWGDSRWWLDNRREVHRHFGAFRITWSPAPKYNNIDVKVLKHVRSGLAISPDPWCIYGSNSGHGAVNLAAHFGVRRIVLLGFDMKTTAGNNWHNYHKRHAREARYKHLFLPEMKMAVRILQLRGIEVINSTPGSALNSVPVVSIADLEPSHEQVCN